jgi:hypothetical protein
VIAAPKERRALTEWEHAVKTQTQLSGPTAVIAAAGDARRSSCGRAQRGWILSLLPLLRLVAVCGQSILIFEPVSADSRVAQLIAEAQKQGMK